MSSSSQEIISYIREFSIPEVITAEAIPAVGQAERTTNPLRILSSRVLTETSDLLTTSPEGISRTLKGLMSLGVLIYTLRIAIAIYYITKELQENYETNNGDLDVEAAKLTLQTYGIDALDALVWLGILILFLAGGPGLVAAPCVWFGYAFDLGESKSTYSKKIAGIAQERKIIQDKISEIAGKITAAQDGELSESEKSELNQLTQQKQNLEAQAKILETQEELHKLNRTLNRGLCTVSLLNASVLFSMQVCIKFGLLLALSSVAPPLTIAVLSVFVAISIISVIYTFAVHKPKDKELEKELVALRGEETNRESPEQKTELSSSVLGSSTHPAPQCETPSEPTSINSLPQNIVRNCSGQMHFQPAVPSLVRRDLIPKLDGIPGAVRGEPSSPRARHGGE